MRLPRWLFILFATVSIVYLITEFWKNEGVPSAQDTPAAPEQAIQTLVVYPVSRVNDVLVWTTDTTGGEEALLYLAPTSDTVNLLKLFEEKMPVRVAGRFYDNKSIPDEYAEKKPKPASLRVFQVKGIALADDSNYK